PGMKEGYTEHFVGRRREQQRLLPALKSGDIDVLIITGLGGSGKSALATRLARKLETSGFIPIPVASSKENPLNSTRLLQAFGDAYREAARKHRSEGATQKASKLDALVHDFKNPELSVEDRLHDAVASLNEGRFLLLLDNFESNLDEADRHILDSEISRFYQYLLESLSGSSRAIITARYLPSDVSTLPPKVLREDLSDFPESSFLKILQRDPEVERRSRSGELPMALLRELYKKFGGTPRFLLQIREVIKKMDAELLKAELAKVELPTGTEPGELEKLRDEYVGGIFIERLFGYLSPESQKALSRAAVYGVAVNLEGLAAVAGVPLNDAGAFARSWQDRALAYQVTDKSWEYLWIVYGLLRGWLLDRLSADERKGAHKAAGDFLVELEKQNLEGMLGLSCVDCLMEARSQYLHSMSFEPARATTNRLSGVLTRSGFYDGVRSLNSELLEFEEHPSPMSWIARTYLDQGDYVSAKSWYQRCLAASSGLNPQMEAMALHGLAMIDANKGDHITASKKFEESLKIQKEVGDREGEASTWHALATIDLIFKGNHISARGKYEKSLKIRQQIDDREGEAATWNQLAMIDLIEDDCDSALVKYGKSLKIREQIGDRAGEAITLQNLSTIDANKGNYDSALDKCEKSLKIQQQIGDRAGEAATFNQIGIISDRRGRTEEGLRLVAISYLIVKSIGHEKSQLCSKNLSVIASRLNYSQESFDDMLKEVADSYAKDRGQGLIEAAFPKG
ncbi:MAG TPA: tetratricopeptide repeat protein, partial [Methanothrix sp.]|nr:tetratricopeptide repeat protein [Methanothrix sp.]